MGHDALTIRDRLRIDFNDRIRKNGSRNVVEDAWLEDLNAGEHQRWLVSERLRYRGHAGETRNQTIMRLDHTKALASGVAFQDQGGQSILCTMMGQGSIQIEIGDQFAVNHREGLSVKKGARIIKRTAGAQNHRLVHVLEMHAKIASITERAPDRVGLVMKIHDQVFDSEGR